MPLCSPEKPERAGAGRWRWMLGALLALTAFGVLAGTAAAKRIPQVEIVSQSPPPPPAEIPANTHYFSTIQAAVDATTKNHGDWVLIEPGIYTEEVVVKHEHSGIHIRGMDRNEVILDGQHKLKPHGSNGIMVEHANNVWIENLTARNFDRANSKGEADGDGGGGNEIWWSGNKSPETKEERSQGAHGWWGRYLTAYDTGLLGGYGIFAQHMTEGSWEHIYASGFNDSGIYIGACWECKAKVSDATIEGNAVGYSGSNSGGRLVIEKSVFKNNTSGIDPNGEVGGDGPPPSNGMCNAPRPKSPYYNFPTTNVERCEIFKENLVTENNNLTAPDNGSTEVAPWGVGVELPGVMATLTENNTITNNVNNGVLGFEYPNPYPPCEKPAKEHCGPKTIFFQFTGNKIANNTFSGNGTSGAPFAGDLMMQGGLFPHEGHASNSNCVSGNTFTAAVFPAEVENEWGCQNTNTRPPNNGPAGLEYIAELSLEAQSLRKAEDQPEPGPQPTMPHPCAGVPITTVCPNGEEAEKY